MAAAEKERADALFQEASDLQAEIANLRASHKEALRKAREAKEAIAFRWEQDIGHRDGGHVETTAQFWQRFHVDEFLHCLLGHVRRRIE